MSNSLMLKISAVAVAAGAAVMQMPSAEAQIVAVPVTGGGFVVRYDTTEGFKANYTDGNIPTFVTPVGTIAVTGTPSLPFWQPGIVIDVTDTPIGVEIDNINGSVSLNDGRNATLNNSPAKLQAIAKVTGGDEPFFPDEPTFGTVTTITANFRSGSINVPQSAFSALPSPQFVIPITNGTFTLNIPENQAAFPVITFNSVITPLGTTNLTFSFPASVPESDSCGCRLFLPVDSPADISVVVNGTIALNDGRTANINNRLVTFQANARVTNPSESSYYVADVPFEPYTVTGEFSNFNLSIPASDITSPVVTTTSLPSFQLTQSSDPNLVPVIIPDLDDSPLAKRRF
ncbi:hypothetical protein [Pseudanabaena sp. SR411]|uniref:hypothetical protein n=1 Tax=Pseudanabaena sp. SR411 TaxID=1980935 RepID=UPI0011404C2E|nr:hypothetical protein [Pseudanabaena sp. SR411]